MSNGRFIFTSYEGNIGKGRFDFSYVVEANNKRIQFTDTLIFPPVAEETIPPQLLKNLLEMLHLMFGVSYWKLYCPKTIAVNSMTLSKEQAMFWNTIYTKGLGELFYKNSIDFQNLIRFPFSEKSVTPVPFERKDRSLLMVGGGKDSIVSGELLNKNENLFDAFVINEHPLQREVIKTLSVASLKVKHIIDPTLISLSKSGEKGTYNGHVPMVAMYSAMCLCMAVFHDYRFVVASNERSADEGNVTYLGKEINHQWSKTFEFERMFQDYIKTVITPSVSYFSLLRPITEIHIAKLFSDKTPYFRVFSSCNRNFTISGDKPSGRWCGLCPKCAGVFLLLSPFLPKETLISIFGKNLFADLDLLPLFEELVGIRGTKPFECVATIKESQFALKIVIDKKLYQEDPVIQALAKEKIIDDSEKEMLAKTLFDVSEKHAIPECFWSILKTL
jgi:hypothetical protein